jgi:hypothetical protein
MENLSADIDEARARLKSRANEPFVPPAVRALVSFLSRRREPRRDLDHEGAGFDSSESGCHDGKVASTGRPGISCTSVPSAFIT